jgi:hypothetical protein
VLHRRSLGLPWRVTLSRANLSCERACPRADTPEQNLDLRTLAITVNIGLSNPVKV